MHAIYFDKELAESLVLKTDFPKPQRKPGEVLIRLLTAGVCNTDLEIVKGYMGFTGVPGHEFVGIVEEADDIAWIGKRVCGDINAACGVCDVCKNHEGHHCPNRTVLGIVNHNGAFAQYFTLPQSNLYEVPDNVTNEMAVFTEPLAAAFEIPEQVKIEKNHTVIVLGDGKLGLLIAQVMRLFSDQVILLGRHAEKMALVEKFGIQTALSDSFEKIMMADLVVEATGSAQGLEKAIALTKPKGTIVLKSTVAEAFEINLAPLVIHEISLVGSRCGPFDKALASLANAQVDVTSLISDILPLDQGVFALEKAAEKGVLKVLLQNP